MSQPRPLLSPPETEEQLLAQAQPASNAVSNATGINLFMVLPQ